MILWTLSLEEFCADVGGRCLELLYVRRRNRCKVEGEKSES